MSDDEIRDLADRPGWTVDIEKIAATYAPTEGGWSAKIRWLRGSGRGYDRWHVAVVDGTGHCHYAKPTTYLPEARRIAEGWVDGHARSKN